jgi:hypothetical protein
MAYSKAKLKSSGDKASPYVTETFKYPKYRCLGLDRFKLSKNEGEVKI